MENELVNVVIIDPDGCKSGMLSEDVAMTLIAVASEDPANWDEMVAFWPRYVTRVVPEFAANLPIETVDREVVLDRMRCTDDWIVLDLVQKRFLSGKEFPVVTRDACFTMHTEENGDQKDPLSIHLPPWWELGEQVDPSEIMESRKSPINIPSVDRECLFGQPLIRDLAERILTMAVTEAGQKAIESLGLENPAEHRGCYPMTIKVHRDWLMTPREDMGGRYPRQMLHGAADWIDQLVWAQRLRFEQGGSAPFVALPLSSPGYTHGPVGREEMAVYFDYCRELIGEGWLWCKNHLAELPAVAETDPLVAHLNEVKTAWLAEPFEGDSPPAFIIECSRRRVPRGAGVEIVGMDQRQTEEHVGDCDCPICNMVADGGLGIGFTGIDGHHLELDDEFAFSMCETRKEWEAKQLEFAEFSAKFNEREAEQKLSPNSGDPETDEFDSAWSNSLANLTNESIPGDASGHLKLAFLLADVVTELNENDAPDKWAKQLNADFSAYRKSDRVNLSDSTQTLSATLELIAEQVPVLVPRVADFQSQLAERLREPAGGSEEGTSG